MLTTELLEPTLEVLTMMTGLGVATEVALEEETTTTGLEAGAEAWLV